MSSWRIFIRRNWRMLSRVGAAAVLAVAALLIALPRASAEGGHADAGHDDATATVERLYFSPERLASRHFAHLFGVPKA